MSTMLRLAPGRVLQEVLVLLLAPVLFLLRLALWPLQQAAAVGGNPRER